MSVESRRHDWVPSEPLDDYGTTRWACWRCDEAVTLGEGDTPTDMILSGYTQTAREAQ